MSATAFSHPAPPPARRIRDAFVALVGPDLWSRRLAAIGRQAAFGPNTRQATLRRYAVELTIERFRWAVRRPATPTQRFLASLTADLVALADELPPAGRDRLSVILQDALSARAATLVPLFHLMRTAALQRQRGFSVRFAGLADAAPFDLLLSRQGSVAELACDTIPAEHGRDIAGDAWCRFSDRVEPVLRAWLAAHPGAYLLRITLPVGLQEGAAAAPAALHDRVAAMLAHGHRRDEDGAAVLRLDTVPPALHHGGEARLHAALRRAFGPEARLLVATSPHGSVALAVRAGRENAIAAALCRGLAPLASARLTGTRPGILAVLIEDASSEEWRAMRETFDLELEARRFLVCPEARPVVAVSCASRCELFGLAPPDAVAGGDLRFRNAAHPAAGAAGLAPAVMSSV